MNRHAHSISSGPGPRSRSAPQVPRGRCPGCGGVDLEARTGRNPAFIQLWCLSCDEHVLWRGQPDLGAPGVGGMVRR
jgi:hypothetical protein